MLWFLCNVSCMFLYPVSCILCPVYCSLVSCFWQSVVSRYRAPEVTDLPPPRCVLSTLAPPPKSSFLHVFPGSHFIGFKRHLGRPFCNISIKKWLWTQYVVQYRFSIISGSLFEAIMLRKHKPCHSFHAFHGHGSDLLLYSILLYFGSL